MRSHVIIQHSPLHDVIPSRNTVPQRRRIKIDKPSYSASVSKTDPTNYVAFYFRELKRVSAGALSLR
jgi:hypothetical protein